MRREIQLRVADVSVVVNNSTFTVALMEIINPTVYPLVVRAGGSDVPRTTDDASFWIPPNTARTRAVEGNNFAFGLLIGSAGFPAPVLSSAYPTTVEITLLSAGETPSIFSSMPIGLIAPSATILKDQPGNRAINTYGDAVTLPPGVRTCLLRFPNPAALGMSFISVAGVQSGRKYLTIATRTDLYSHVASTGLINFWFLVDPEADTSLNVFTQVNANNDSAYLLLGYQERLPQGAIQADARPMVDILAPNASTVPVAVAQLYPNVPTPAYDTNGSALGALAGVTLCSITNMAAGEYRVEAEMASADTAAVGHYLFLLHNPGNKHVIYMPSPGYAAPIISRATFALNDSLAIVVGAVTTAGALVAGSIRAYRLA